MSSNNLINKIFYFKIITLATALIINSCSIKSEENPLILPPKYQEIPDETTLPSIQELTLERNSLSINQENLELAE